MPMTIIRALSRTLDTLRPLWVGLFVAVLAVPSPERLPLTRDRALALAAAFLLLWLLAGWADHTWWRPTPLDIPWLIWLLLIPVTLWATAVPEQTYAALRLFVAQALAFWTLAAWVRTPRRAAWAAVGLLAAGVLLAVLGLFWMQWPSGYLFPVPERLRALREHYALPIQESVNKNILAGVLAPLWGLSLGAIFAPRGKGRWVLRALALAAAGLIGSMVVLSQSRGSWVGSVAAVYVLLALTWRPTWLGLLAFPPAVVLLRQQGRLLPLLDRALALEQTGNLAGRVELWSRALYAMQDFVFTGIGMGTFSRVIPLLYPLFLYSPNASVPHAHNLLLQVGVDLGLFGLIAFLAMILVTAALVRQALRAPAADQATARWLLRGAAAGCTAILVHGLVDAATWNTRPAFLAWALWGLVVGLAMTLSARDAGGTS